MQQVWEFYVHYKLGCYFSIIVGTAEDRLLNLDSLIVETATMCLAIGHWSKRISSATPRYFHGLALHRLELLVRTLDAQDKVLINNPTAFLSGVVSRALADWFIRCLASRSGCFVPNARRR